MVCGWVDLSRRQAELRTFRVVGKQFEARHGWAIDIEADVYAEMLKELEGFLRIQRVEFRTNDVAPVPKRPNPVVEEGPQASTTGPMLGMLGLGILLGLAIGYLVFG